MHENRTDMLKFISFGSGSSGNCYYLGTASDGLMIDIGVGIRTLKKYCKDYGIQLSSIRHLLITHDHADHIKSVGSFSYEYKVPVYATEMVHLLHLGNHRGGEIALSQGNKKLLPDL